MLNKMLIYKVPAEAFLIKDDSLSDSESKFYKWLRNEGFTFACPKGQFGCNWAYVNITHKIYAYGMPCVGFVKPVGNHAITVEEFFSIYEIYSKYRGLDPLDMNS